MPISKSSPFHGAVAWLLGVVAIPSLATPVYADPTWAVLRVTSHGCSGTCIESSDEVSLVLTCAHVFLRNQRFPGEPDTIDPQLLARSFAFDCPHPDPRPAERPGIRLVKYDVGSDLALVAVFTRLPYVCPVAPAGSAFDPAVQSVGYDLMRWPATVRQARITSVQGLRQFTLERPRSGRSGGPLIGKAGLVGVCTGFLGEPSPAEIVQGGPGVYVSHAAILRFLRVEEALKVAAPNQDRWDGRYRLVPRPVDWIDRPGSPSVGESSQRPGGS